ncbi:tannase/feruloyl esterase family alpha/beta hydrolase [Phenylobacterium sp.]|uniref:tannase/feruloyl esterase family alpha/beta hydrolase n=1 Tax=Phenylobacterium sp. TaxID=1871053 RepID=UPI0012153DF4|nr:tannase/feruloyl esterase family alpha/beta hydrolase [Phenylobacterium sp.]THD59517.1 MAG: tannase/feruloyl esterase family alpha/beta hydrolase [Phenylobacterium sp.]
MRLILLASAGLALAAPAAARAETACADMAHAALPHAEITNAKPMAIKGGQGCQIELDSHPTADSDIKIEVLIPIGQAWNGKFVQVGNGGLAGSIPWAQVKLRADEGYAAAGTDDGHGGNGRTAIWALGHPQKIADFGWRSLKETTDAAKLLIKAQKDEAPKRAYFVGCSAGGREALMEAQRFPGDFDGIVAGATANYNTLGYAGRAYMQQVLARPGGYLALPQLQLLQDAALKQCANGEPFIRDQLACHFDPAVLKCRPGQTEGCLTAPQIASAKAIYGGRIVNGKVAYPGYEPGAEALRGGWQAWNTGVSQDRWTESSGHAMGSQFMKYFLYDDPSFDFLKMDTGAKLDRDRQKLAKDLDATDANLTPFASHGGKLIQYHGWNDPAIAPRGSIRYHDAVLAETKDAASFYRLYMIPGMLHCQGGNGPGTVDWLSILDRWVEAKQAPHEVTATGQGGASQLLCPYPGVARKAGEAWACSAAKKG